MKKAPERAMCYCCDRDHYSCSQIYKAVHGSKITFLPATKIRIKVYVQSCMYDGWHIYIGLALAASTV